MGSVNFLFKNKSDQIDLEISKLNHTEKLRCAFYAVTTHQTANLRKLLTSMDSVNVPFKSKTLLMAAAVSNNFIATKILIEEFNADIRAVCDEGFSASDYARHHQYLSIAHYLDSKVVTHQDPIETTSSVYNLQKKAPYL